MAVDAVLATMDRYLTAIAAKDYARITENAEQFSRIVRESRGG